MKKFGPSIFTMGYAWVAFREIGKLQGVSRKDTLCYCSFFTIAGWVVKKLCVDAKQQEAIYAVHPLLLLLFNLHIPKPLISRLAAIFNFPRSSSPLVLSVLTRKTDLLVNHQLAGH
jgi:hypothetical protein